MTIVTFANSTMYRLGEFIADLPSGVASVDLACVARGLGIASPPLTLTPRTRRTLDSRITKYLEAIEAPNAQENCSMETARHRQIITWCLPGHHHVFIHPPVCSSRREHEPFFIVHISPIPCTKTTFPTLAQDNSCAIFSSHEEYVVEVLRC